MSHSQSNTKHYSGCSHHYHLVPKAVRVRVEEQQFEDKKKHVSQVIRRIRKKGKYLHFASTYYLCNRVDRNVYSAVCADVFNNSLERLQ
mmetsp:Transcript_23779/g.34041  ORF Transcript_23779/g.34041 Transcript_23779/m.34041 type:complete len:89 (+) Transcript_23779:480-746(+)